MRTTETSTSTSTSTTTDSIMDRRTEEMLQNALTPTQKKIWTQLRTGGEYPSKELRQVCLDAYEGYGDTVLLRMHVSLLRRKLRLLNWDIECVRRAGRAYYRLVKTPVAPPGLGLGLGVEGVEGVEGVSTDD